MNAILQVMSLKNDKQTALLHGISEAFIVATDFSCLYCVFAFLLFMMKIRKLDMHWMRIHSNFAENIMERYE